MESGWRYALRSVPIEFIVGPQRKRFSIHSGALQYMSTRLDDHILWLELSEDAGLPQQPVYWPTVDEDTFLRFAKFVYTGDYDVPVPSSPYPSLSPSMSSPPLASNAMQSEYVTAAPTLDNNSSGRGSAKGRSAFNRRLGPYHSLDSWYQVLRHNPHKRLVPGADQELSDNDLQQTAPYHLLSRFCSLPYSTDEDPYPDFDGETLLAHARLYSLAVNWQVPSLRRHALNAIYHLLRHGDFLYDRVADISRLIDFAFEPFRCEDRSYQVREQMSLGLDQGPGRSDMLQDMLTLYGACVYAIFMLHPSFTAICNLHGEFAAGILDLLVPPDEEGDDNNNTDILDVDSLVELAVSGADPRDHEAAVDELVDGLAELRTGEWGAEDFDAGEYEEWWSTYG
ncbi:hypothetical protein F4810DRAFT_670799 [Camillea tinctor]|nr:hypothetical protein F4810DRAFT_670799 [Camillea tinctor]